MRNVVWSVLGCLWCCALAAVGCSDSDEKESPPHVAGSSGQGGDFTNAVVLDIGDEGDAHTQMKRLFSLLRDTDALDADVIYAHLPPQTDEFLALYNRIIRAAGCEVIKL